ncbi:keratin-associated protein 5-4-like [Ruditapes philippinarum]|uniref:keratin-associated protein 5-4-like n=1 Tax=Ruditapes philippinarum TaxID=129788 RepID=UPI00295BBB6F|nr:keratin-associated protein 5-4-like [Ruditapes philippinarum]
MSLKIDSLEKNLIYYHIIIYLTLNYEILYCKTNMDFVGYILILTVGVFGIICCIGSEQNGRCTCNTFRCPMDRVNSGSCYSSSLPGGWGVRCCKPYCKCKHSCEADETDEGKFETLAENKSVTSQNWHLVNIDKRDHCPENTTLCCPKCKCQRGVCNKKEIKARKKSCGDKHKLCCQPQSTLFRPVPGCKDNELPLSFSGSDHLYGLCQCKKECEMHEAFLDHNTCGENRDMCCKLCACKPECDSFDIDIGQGLCGYQLQQCCRACVCKTPCNKPEELLGPEGCFYGETVCCVT